MRKIVIVLLIVFSFAIEIDVDNLIKKIRQNPNDTKNRIIIASYFIKQKNYLKAKKYLDEVLKIDPKNIYAKKLLKKLKALKVYSEIIKNYGNINAAIENLYKENKYKKLISIYNSLKILKKININDSEKIKLARVLMWEGKYDDSINLLNTLKNKKNLDYYEIMAYNLYYKGDYKQSQKYFNILYQTSGDTKFAKKLLEIYFNLGEYSKAKKLILTLNRSNPKLAKQFEKKLLNIQERSIKELKKEYEKKPSFENLKKYAISLFQKDKEKAIEIVKNYANTHPHENRAVIFLAELLSWSGKNDEALEYLSKINNNTQAKLLLGKILAWQGKYKKAVVYLSDVYENGNKSQQYEAKKMIGYVYLWEGKKQKAKKIFEELIKQNPNDKEIEEELMIINGKIKPVIEKYKKLLKKFPNREDYILKLADLYYLTKNYSKAAFYYEKYLKKHPENLEIYKTLGDIYLENKNFYKGFGLWEYYANYKNTKEAYYELALRYFWNGFNKEALKVLDELLKKYPNYEKAIILKAKILKINPRFVNSSSAATIDEFFGKKSDQLKIFGDRAYFNGFYETAAEYYKEYLFLQPNDYNVREKYAYALEHSKKYSKAAGEFFLLMWYKKDSNIEYHYAYNLQKSGKIKKAKEIYQKLLQEVPKPAPDFIKKFLNEWKNAWESMDIKKYSNFYSPKIKNNLYWKLKKEAIFKKAGFINVGIYDPVLIYNKDNIYKIKFFQIYASKTKKDKGYKFLTLKCKNKKCLIIKETWKAGKYIPYNKNNSLEKYIKQNLKEIDKKNIEKIKIIKKKETKKPVIPLGFKTKIISEKKAFNLKILQPVKLSKEIALSKKIKKISRPLLYSWKTEGDIDYFTDNQHMSMWINSLKISKNIKKQHIFVFFKDYYLNQSKSNKKGSLFGIGFKKGHFLFDVFKDNSGKNTIGWDFSYYLLGMQLNINRHNMVYSRRSICSSKHTKIKTELTGYKTLSPHRNLWWSAAFEKVDDSNNVFTPQIEYDFYNKFIKKDPLVFYFSGWYQFNSKQTLCYYSPKKTDTNIIGIKHTHKFNPFCSSLLKAGVGYSFWDKSYTYNISGFFKYNKNNFYTKAGCILSNSHPLSNNVKNYQSIECTLNARIMW